LLSHQFFRDVQAKFEEKESAINARLKKWEDDFTNSQDECLQTVQVSSSIPALPTLIASSCAVLP